MNNKNAVFSDMDGTLCFHEKIHKIDIVHDNHDGTVRVRDKANGQIYEAFDVSVSGYRIFLAKETQQLGRELIQTHDLICVTGARPETVYKRASCFDFASAFILENGGLIFNKNLEINMEWFNYLEPEREYLKEVREVLISLGWHLDDKGRTSAIRVRRQDNPHKSLEEFNNICTTISLPEEVKKTRNLDNLDIILASAGKDNAVRFWIDSNGYNREQTVGMGDDINDMEFLAITSRKFVTANAYPEVLALARKNGWTITAKPNFDGVKEIFQTLINGHREFV